MNALTPVWNRVASPPLAGASERPTQPLGLPKIFPIITQRDLFVNQQASAQPVFGENPNRVGREGGNNRKIQENRSGCRIKTAFSGKISGLAGVDGILESTSDIFRNRVYINPLRESDRTREAGKRPA